MPNDNNCIIFFVIFLNEYIHVIRYLDNLRCILAKRYCAILFHAFAKVIYKKGYCQLVGCSLICWLGLLDRPSQQIL